MKLDCHIVQDLLPSYMENLTSSETNHDIVLHIQTCEDCAALYKNMRYDIESSAEQDTKKAPLDYLKKIRSQYFYRSILGIAILFIVLLRLILFLCNIITLYTLEVWLMIPIISATLWFILKDTFPSACQKKAPLFILHGVLFLFSSVFLFFMLRFDTIIWYPRKHFFGIPLERLGPILHTFLFSSLWLTILLCLYGLYTSMKRSRIYYSIVCHGLGIIYMLLSVDTVLLRMDMSSPTNNLFSEAAYLYIEGLIVAVLYGLCCSKIFRLLRKK